MPSKGARVATTVRLRPDVHATAARRAAGWKWTLGDYIAWCVERSAHATPHPNAKKPELPLGPIPVPPAEDGY